MTRKLNVVLLLLTLLTACDATSFQGELFSDEYYRWFYRWHRGGAWMAHQERHECFGTNWVCAFAPRNNTQIANLKLSVNTTLAKQLAMVEVKYTLNSIANDDLVAVYLVDPEEINDVDEDPLSDFVDYVYANESRVMSSGEYSVIFGPLVNMRASYKFKYLRKVESVDESEEFPTYEVLWESPFVEMERGHTKPLQIRLALTGKKDEMRATWVSGQVFGPSVKIGTATSGKLEHRVEATTGTYDALDMCNAPATTRSSVYFRHPGYLHDAVMTDLILVKNISIVWEVQRDFDEASRDDARPDTPEYAALIHIGDISYAKGKTYLWEQFGAIVQPVASRLPYMVGIGNHEYDYIVNGEGHDLSGSEAALSNGWHPDGGNFNVDSHGECGVPYARRFHMPEAMDSTANPPFWYSFRLGLTHHVILSSEHRCTPGAPMREWLEREFRDNVDREMTPWLVVHLHRPLYCSESYEGDHAVAELLRGCLEDLLAAHSVDLDFSGHYHAYERTCPVFHNECLEQDGSALAPIHIMIGSGGAELDDISYLPS